MARETVRIEGLDALLRRLKALGPEAAKRGGPVRVAVRKAAVVIQQEMQANVRRITDEPNVGGANRSTGLLEKSIKPMRAAANKRGLKGESYIVTVARRAKYPASARNPKGMSAAQVGRILEYHTYTTAAGATRGPYPWARPAFHAKKGEAVDVMKSELLRGIERLEKKLARTR